MSSPTTFDDNRLLVSLLAALAAEEMGINAPANDVEPPAEHDEEDH